MSPTLTPVTVIVMALGVFTSVTADREVETDKVSREARPREARRAFQKDTETTCVRVHLCNRITPLHITSLTDF